MFCNDSARTGTREIRPCSHQLAQNGFTLVEMAIVLVVIGLILGAVMIGKDVQRNAEYTKIKQKFIDQWVVAYNTYFQRTGVPVGDSQTAPQLMVNGENFSGSSGGDMTSATPPDPVCEGDGSDNLRTLMLAAGVEMPPGRSEGAEDRYVYLDTNGNPQELQVCFRWNPPGTDSGSGNVMEIRGITPDLARFLDQAIDGKADAWEGALRQADITATSQNAPGEQWSANNTYGLGSSSSTATGSGEAKDEDQVITVIAHYKMNQ